MDIFLKSCSSNRKNDFKERYLFQLVKKQIDTNGDKRSVFATTLFTQLSLLSFM